MPKAFSWDVCSIGHCGVASARAAVAAATIVLLLLLLLSPFAVNADLLVVFFILYFCIFISLIIVNDYEFTLSSSDLFVDVQNVLNVVGNGRSCALPCVRAHSHNTERIHFGLLAQLAHHVNMFFFLVFISLADGSERTCHAYAAHTAIRRVSECALCVFAWISSLRLHNVRDILVFWSVLRLYLWLVITMSFENLQLYTKIKLFCCCCCCRHVSAQVSRTVCVYERARGINIRPNSAQQLSRIRCIALPPCDKLTICFYVFCEPF